MVVACMETVGSVLFVNTESHCASMVILNLGNSAAYFCIPLLFLREGWDGVLCWILNVPCIGGVWLLLLLPPSQGVWFLVVNLHLF